MKKLPIMRAARGFAALALALAMASPVAAMAQELVPVGRAVGIEAVTDGLLVASLSRVKTAEGERSPAADAGVLPGDLLVRIGGEDISTEEDFTRALAALDGGEVELTVLRDEKTLRLALTPAKDTEGVWRLGL